MNKIILTGNLVKDSEVKFIPVTGTAINEFVLANNVGYGEHKKTNFIKCVLFGKRAESMVNLLVQGTSVLIDGELELTAKQDKDGKWVNYTQVKVNEIEITKFMNKTESTTGKLNEAVEIKDDGDMLF